MKVTPNPVNVVRMPQCCKSEWCLTCHLAFFSHAQERSPGSRPEGKSDSSSSATAAILLCLPRAGLAAMRFGHQRMCLLLKRIQPKMCCRYRVIKDEISVITILTVFKHQKMVDYSSVPGGCYFCFRLGSNWGKPLATGPVGRA